MPPFDARDLAFQLLIDCEEVLDFQAHVRLDIVHILDLFNARIVFGNRENLLIELIRVDHVQGAHWGTSIRQPVKLGWVTNATTSSGSPSSESVPGTKP